MMVRRIRVLHFMETPKIEDHFAIHFSEDILPSISSYSVIYILVIAGLGRVGKSTILNCFIGESAKRDLLKGFTVAECNETDSNFFLSDSTGDAVTHGIDAAIVPLKEGGVYNFPANSALLLFDVEGLRNKDTKGLDLVLAICTQLGHHLVFVDQQLNDPCRENLNRLVVSKLIHAPTAKMPYLHLVANKTDLDYDPGFVDPWFDQRSGPNGTVISSISLLSLPLIY
jgi:hypothetical protein